MSLAERAAALLEPAKAGCPACTHLAAITDEADRAAMAALLDTRKPDGVGHGLGAEKAAMFFTEEGFRLTRHAVGKHRAHG